MPKTKVEVYDKNQLIYPFIESDHVTFSNGMKVSEMLDQSISMPTVTHEDLSFKVGVGDQDVSSAIVDSSVSKMTIKGKTYQNILPEPSTHVLTNNKEMFKVNEGLDPNVEIVDGVSKSAILSGQTLVNCLGTPIGGTPTASYSNGVLNFSDNWSGQNYDFTPVVKPNTQYTAIFFLSTPIPTNRNLAIGYLAGGSWQGTNYYKLGDGVSNVVRVKIASGDTNDRLRVRYDSATPQTATNVAVSMRIVVLEGDWTNAELPFNNGFEGMTSCKMPVLTTIGKNLFNLPLVQGSQTYGTIGGKPTHEIYSHRVTNEPNKYIKVKPNTQITFSIINNDVRFAIAELDEHGNRLGDTGWLDTVSQKTITTKSSTHYIGFNFKKVGNADITVEEVINSNPMFEYSNTSTSYEPYKSNILHAPEEVVLRSLPNGVKDTLNLMTSEYVQRIGEKMLKGASNEGWIANYKGASYQFVLPIEDATSVLKDNKVATLNSDTIPSVPNHTILTEELNVEKWGIAQRSNGNKGVFIAIPASAIETYTVESFKQWLAQNPITVQYELATPVVKTVDLSSSGNWEKVVLDGKSSENWQQNSHSGNFVQFEGYSNFCLYSLNLPLANRGLLCDKLSYYGYDSGFRHKGIEGISDGGGYRLIFVRVKTEKLPTNDVAGFRQWLSQNPIEVSYMLSSNKDSTQVKQPIFFKDGHIQLSSGVDHSLIPTLDYQAKTSNSYVMDLMKANTRYTMKAKSASGNFTLGGSSYSLGTNRVFSTTGAEFNANNMMVITGSYEDLMILEGELTSKTIPYFKGIKSAFEDESKIEVLSTGKNLITDVSLRKINGAIWDGDVLTYSGTSNDLYYTYSRNEMTHERAIKVKVGSCYEVGLEVFSGEVNVGYSVAVATFDKDLNVVRWLDGRFVVQQGEEYVGSIRLHGVNAVWTNIKFRMWMEEVDTSSNVGAYEPYKSNVTKIPLLSPLRSLPNGVCDELIVDRMKNKATLIQRVGYGTLGRQGHEYYCENSSIDTNLYQPWYTKDFGDNVANSTDASTMLCDKLLVTYENYRGKAKESICMYPDKSANFVGCLLKSTLGVKTVKQWFEANEVSVYYQLATPVITEIDLEGFPYIYKDGHIFLNSEIAPITEITYSINQCQQISASNEDIIRHEKELTYLQKLIAQYIQVDYESVLLSLKV